jgi:hypothetical protein
MTLEPGIYEMPSDIYHADPCPTPSLSAGMINLLLEAPAKCYAASPRLNPAYEEPESQDKFTIGTVSHLMHLEPELFDRRVAVIDAADWRGKDAKNQRDYARANGITPILTGHMEKVRAARIVFLASPFTRGAFANGKPEQSMFWRHPLYGFWCRARPDFIANARTHMNDYKATANANPAAFGRHAYSMGYHRRAAWYLEGAAAVFGFRPDHYWFCNQETKSPFLTSVVELDWQAIEAGQAENDHAAGIFANCLETGDWYGYRDPDHLHADRAFRVGLPNYSYSEIDNRLNRNAWPEQQLETEKV